MLVILAESSPLCLSHQEEYKLWLEAYRSHDVLKIEELAKKRDLKARKASMALHKADRFLLGLANMWELKY